MVAPFSESCHKLRQGHAKRFCNPVNVAKCRVTLASLDATEIRPIKSAFLCEPFLRIAFSLSQFANPIAKAHQDVGFRRPHAGRLGRLRSMSPRVISIIVSTHFT